MQYSKASNSDRAKTIRDMILSRIELGKDQQEKLVHHVAANVPRDRYVPPKKMRFLHETIKGDVVLVYDRSGKEEVVSIHRHALGQMCGTIGLPILYVNRLDAESDGGWRRDLLCDNLNVLFQRQEFLNRLKQPASFLHRLVGDQLRAFLTQSYNRHLVSAALLVPFLDACRDVGAMPVTALVSDLRVGLQCYLPYVFEPVKGEFIAVGVWWCNSDFGSGRLKVSHTVMRATSGTSAVMEDTFSRVHLGSVVRESDIDLGEEVASKELDTVVTAIKAAVQEVLKPEAVDRLLDVIERAAEEGISFTKLKGKLSSYLKADEINKLRSMSEEQIVDLPPPSLGKDGNGQELLSKWWVTQAISKIAENESDPDRQADLRQIAGQFLGESV